MTALSVIQLTVKLVEVILVMKLFSSIFGSPDDPALEIMDLAPDMEKVVITVIIKRATNPKRVGIFFFSKLMFFIVNIFLFLIFSNLFY